MMLGLCGVGTTITTKLHTLDSTSDFEGEQQSADYYCCRNDSTTRAVTEIVTSIEPQGGNG